MFWKKKNSLPWCPEDDVLITEMHLHDDSVYLYVTAVYKGQVYHEIGNCTGYNNEDPDAVVASQRSLPEDKNRQCRV